MNRIYIRISRILFVIMLILCTAYVFRYLGIMVPLQSGFDTGEVSYLSEDWICTPEDGSSFSTTLPNTLPLPDGTQMMTLTTTLPDEVYDDDVLRFHTLLGWYNIYINDELRLSYGNEEITEKTLLENGSNMLLVPLSREDSGATLRVETGYEITDYLAQQKPPTFSTHRDLLMQDLIGSSTSMFFTFFILIIAFILFIAWLVFRITKQSYRFLLLCSIFLVLSMIYYNTANTFRAELWGYPETLPMYSDFAYYFLEFFLPVLAYHLIISATKKELPRKFHIFILVHTCFASIVMVQQMLWIANIYVLEVISALFILIGFIWLFCLLRPFSLTTPEKKVILPAFACVLGFLLDYYKLAGLWFPMPDSWVAYLQTTLPFMFFFPIALGFLAPLSLWTIINLKSQERLILKRSAEEAALQVSLAEREYLSSLENINQIRKIRHDINHHLLSIRGLAAKENNAELCTYIDNIVDNIPKKPIRGTQFITDSFIEYYRELCTEYRIIFDTDICYDESKFTDKNQLGIFLGNALKNAFEAASNPKLQNPFIYLKGYEHGNQLIFTVKNNYNGQLYPDYKSTKNSNRGFGISNMRSATEQHNGYLELEHTESIFTVKAVLLMDQ